MVVLIKHPQCLDLIWGNSPTSLAPYDLFIVIFMPFRCC